MTPHLSVLRDSELLYERGIFPQATYIFRHSLTQEVAYDSLLQKKKQEIHEKIGKAIEELYSERLEEFYEMLAHHYSMSEIWEKAYQYLKLSGDKASLRYSAWEAFRLYKEAINVLSREPETEENKRRGIEVRLFMASLMMPLAYPEDSLQILQEGEKLSKDLGDERSLVEFYSSIGMCYMYRGDTIQGTKYCENAFEEAEKIQDIELMAPIGFDLCLSYSILGDLLKIAEVAPRVLALLESTHREYEYFGRAFSPYSAILAVYGLAMGCLGNFEEGKAPCEKAVRFAREINDLYCLSFAEFCWGMYFVYKGDGKNTIEHMQVSVRYAEEAQMVATLGLTWTQLGWGYYLLGELETARKYIEKGLEIQRDTGFFAALSFHYYYLSQIYLDSGDKENARSCAEEALRLARTNNERNLEGISLTLLGQIMGKADISQSHKAEDCIRQGINILDGIKQKPYSSQGYFYLGELYADTGKKEKALKTLKTAEAAFQEMGMDYWLRRTQEVLGRVEA
jgi:tetratricopeptide (TPR) repeat protein